MNVLDQHLVENLRRNGCRVSVLHKRLYNDLDENRNFVVRELAKFESPGMKYALARGGSTEVTVTTPNGEELHSTAFCSEKDQFNKRHGVNKAIMKISPNLGHYLTAVDSAVEHV